MLIDGEPWFLAVDVCKAIGVTSRTAYQKLAADERSTVQRMYCGLQPGKPLVTINEQGLYRLTMRSNKSQAKEFQDWVTGTVLPAIRKDGG
ncbi:BRO-N domain-containing protein [Pelagivirga sediminicola]|uniref:BRO-N domain-containing protein n=1 Tax=Pelagivirga sediminicola TaxID=2170575 RepID=UPI0024341FA8|nr:BRO family protein [Pelagivirga sediminicola]